MQEVGVGLREFGRQLGVSGEAIRKAIKTGRIPASMVGEKKLSSGRGVPTISDPDGARAAFERNTSPNHRQGPKISEGRKRAALESAPPPDAAREIEGEMPSITASRQITEAYKAKMARLEYEEAAGQLVNAEEFKTKFATTVTTARTRLLGVPSKAKGRIPHLAVDEIAIIDELIREALEDIAGGG